MDQRARLGKPGNLEELNRTAVFGNKQEIKEETPREEPKLVCRTV